MKKRILRSLGLILSLTVLFPLSTVFAAEIASSQVELQAKKEKLAEIYTFKCTTMEGVEQSLADFRGKVLLIVNTASKCGFTPQFKELEALYKEKKDEGLVILGFPCKQFSNQEFEKDSDIIEFCQTNYGVSFPMFSRIDVNGKNADPLFRFLKRKAPGFLGSESIKWNFTKFLVDREGKRFMRFGSTTTPRKITKDIDRYLKQ